MFRSISLRSLTTLCVALALCLSTAYAQQRFSAGPRIGLNLSTLRGDVANYKMTPGLVAGAFVMYSSLNHFGISADVLYSQRGGKFSGTDPGNIPVEFTQKINYLEIPIALRYFLTLNGNFRPNIFFGPSLAIPLSAKRINQKRAGVSYPDVSNSGDYNNPDLGLFAGFQLNFRGWGDRQHFLIDGRYTYGLADITSQPGNVYNSTVTLTLGYSFGIGPEYRSRYNR